MTRTKWCDTATSSSAFRPKSTTCCAFWTRRRDGSFPPGRSCGQSGPSGWTKAAPKTSRSTSTTCATSSKGFPRPVRSSARCEALVTNSTSTARIGKAALRIRDPAHRKGWARLFPGDGDEAVGGDPLQQGGRIVPNKAREHRDAGHEGRRSHVKPVLRQRDGHLDVLSFDFRAGQLDPHALIGRHDHFLQA